MTEYTYGMRLRGFSPGCQPKGVLRREDDPSGRYHDLLVYDRELTDEELDDYELDAVETVHTTQYETAYNNKAEGFTVRDLLRILEGVNPNALILVGNNPDDCEDYLYGIHVPSRPEKAATVGFFVEPD